MTGRTPQPPVLQNIPIRTETAKKIRDAFTAPAGAMLLQADYSGIEMRILSHLKEEL